MTPSHLLQQADELLAPQRGAGKQTDKRRAVSNAYYAVFHTVCGAAAYQLIGDAYFRTPEYAAIYRSVGHAALAELCREIVKSGTPTKLKPYCPVGGFGPDMRAFASDFPELRKAREIADYAPHNRLSIGEARDWVDRCREAIRRFSLASDEHRAFSALLITRF